MKFYPRGEKELLGPFHQFMTGDTIDWFLKRDIQLKIEDKAKINNSKKGTLVEITYELESE